MSKTITEIRSSLKEKLMAGISDVLEALVAEIPSNAAKYNEVLQLKTRHKKYKRDWLSGLISQDQANLDYNRLNAAILELIDGLEFSDFDGAKESKPSDERIGKVCFKIPGVMLINEKSECKVWISLDEDTLLKSVDVKLGDQLRDVRVSDTMGAELFDDSDEDAFKIKTYDEHIQPIEIGLLTQWEFRVTPLKEGTFPLVLRITVVVEQNGKELKKTIVLEEEVKIVTEPTNALVEAKEIAGKTIQNMSIIPFSVPENGGAAGKDSNTKGPEGKTSSAFTGAKGILIGTVIGLTALFLIWNGNKKKEATSPTGTSICQDEKHWSEIKESGNPQLLSELLDQCPEATFSAEGQRLLQQWEDSITLLAGNVPDTTVGEEPIPIAEEKPIIKPKETTAPEKQKPSGKKTLLETPEKTEDPAPKPNKQPSVTQKPVPKDIVAYANASRKPLHPDCERKKKKRWESCTEDKIRETVKKYIKQSREELKGSIRISFIITKQGQLANPEVVKTDNQKLVPVVMKGLNELPRFKPGQNSNGDPIDVKYVLPVRFE